MLPIQLSFGDDFEKSSKYLSKSMSQKQSETEILYKIEQIQTHRDHCVTCASNADNDIK